MNSRLRIIVTGLIAQHPMLGGVSWDYVHYILELVRLGHDAFYLEDSLERPYAWDPADNWDAVDCGANVRHLAALMERFGSAAGGHTGMCALANGSGSRTGGVWR